MAADVLVLGAGLAGLAAARDLAAGGGAVEVLEARERVGGRVEQLELPDGRVLQLGGEVVGAFHTAYLALAGELGLSTVPSYVAEPGALSWWLPEGAGQGDFPPGFTKVDAACTERIEAALVALARTVDPDDPWAHPDAAALDAISVAGWMREQGATPAVLRMHEMSALSMAGGSEERRSLLGVLRQVAVAGAEELYGSERWEGMRLSAGSASLALRMGEELGDRIRLGAVVAAIDVAPSGVTVTLRDGEALRAAAVVCALPVGPLRDVAITGVSDERLAALHRQRQARAAKVVAAYGSPVWRATGASGLALSEGIVGSSWPQGPGALSMLVSPERLGVFLSAPPAVRRAEVLALLADLYGPDALEPVAYAERAWGLDPFTQGYIAQWAPGDLTAVGPLHGTHEPPFYVAGSDHWVCGYMEGAVRTGRSAASALLGERSAVTASAAAGGSNSAATKP
jgi:monoamine oxidase